MAADLSGLWYLGGSWAGAVVAERVVRELYGAAWSARRDDRRELADSVCKTTAVVRTVRGVT